MKKLAYKAHIPSIHSSVYLAEGSIIIGRVKIGENSSVWFNSVLRGDVNNIEIGKNTNIQDLSMLHVTESSALTIEDNVTIGHSVTLHACHIGKNALIGMGSTVLDGASIPEYSIVAAGSVVPPGKTYPSRSMIMGSPAKVVRELKDEELAMLDEHYKSYVRYSEDFKFG